MEDIIVRKMEPSEEKSVKDLFQRVYKDIFFEMAPAFDSAVQGEQIYVALYKDMLAGIATVWEPDAFIHYLFVDRDVRRKGVGRAVTDALADTYHLPLTLKCLIAPPGNGIFRKMGWQEVETGSSREGTYALLRYAPSAPLPQKTTIRQIEIGGDVSCGFALNAGKS